MTIGEAIRQFEERGWDVSVIYLSCSGRSFYRIQKGDKPALVVSGAKLITAAQLSTWSATGVLPHDIKGY